MQDPRKNLRLLDRARLYYVVASWWFLLLLQMIEDMRPLHALLPITVVQIFTFIYLAVHHDGFIYKFAIANLLFVAFAMLPTLFNRKVDDHWVKDETRRE